MEVCAFWSSQYIRSRLSYLALSCRKLQSLACVCVRNRSSFLYVLQHDGIFSILFRGNGIIVNVFVFQYVLRISFATMKFHVNPTITLCEFSVQHSRHAL